MPKIVISSIAIGRDLALEFTCEGKRALFGAYRKKATLFLAAKDHERVFASLGFDVVIAMDLPLREEDYAPISSGY